MERHPSPTTRAEQRPDREKEKERWAAIYALNLKADISWEQMGAAYFKSAMAQKDLEAGVKTNRSGHTQSELEAWLEANWSTREKRQRLYQENAWIGDKIRALILFPNDYKTKWAEIDARRNLGPGRAEVPAEDEPEVEDIIDPEEEKKENQERTEARFNDEAKYRITHTDGLAGDEPRSESESSEAAKQKLIDLIKGGKLKKIVLHQTPDLDANFAAYLLEKAIRKYSPDTILEIVLVKKGNWLKGEFNIDTGGRPAGLTLEKDGSLFADHHQKEKGPSTSASQVILESLEATDLLSQTELEPWERNLVKFVTQIDNLDYEITPEFYAGDWSKTLYGLYRIIPYQEIMKIFQEGGPDFDPRQPLDETYTKNAALSFTARKWVMKEFTTSSGEKKMFEVPQKHRLNNIYEATELVKENTERSKNNIQHAVEAMAKEGDLGRPIDHPKWGKTLIDWVSYRKVRGGRRLDLPDIHNEALKAYGYDTLIRYYPSQNSFFIQTNRDLTDIARRVEELKLPPDLIKVIPVRGVMLLGRSKNWRETGKINYRENYIRLLDALEMKGTEDIHKLFPDDVELKDYTMEDIRRQMIRDFEYEKSDMSFKEIMRRRAAEIGLTAEEISDLERLDSNIAWNRISSKIADKLGITLEKTVAEKLPQLPGKSLNILFKAIAAKSFNENLAEDPDEVDWLTGEKVRAATSNADAKGMLQKMGYNSFEVKERDDKKFITNISKEPAPIPEPTPAAPEPAPAPAPPAPEPEPQPEPAPTAEQLLMAGLKVSPEEYREAGLAKLDAEEMGQLQSALRNGEHKMNYRTIKEKELANAFVERLNKMGYENEPAPTDKNGKANPNGRFLTISGITKRS